MVASAIRKRENAGSRIVIQEVAFSVILNRKLLKVILIEDEKGLN